MSAAIAALLLASTPAAATDPVADSVALVQPMLPGTQSAAQDTPAFLWWAGPAERDAAGFATLAQAMRSVPGLVIAAAPGNGTSLLAVHHGRAQPGLLLAGAPVPSSLALPLFDVDLVLATGPAGRVQGAAGMLELLPRRPGAVLAGMGEGAAGGFGSRQAAARLDVPVATGVRAAVSGVLSHDLGWLRNTTTGERLNRGQRAGLAGMVDIDLMPQLTWQLTLAALRNQDGNLPGFTCDPAAPARCNGRFASTGQTAAPAPLSAARWGPIGADLAGQPLGQRADLALYASRLGWHSGAIRLTLDNSLARQTGHLGLDLTDGRRLGALAVPAGLASGGVGLIARTRTDMERHQLMLDGDWGPLALQLGAAVNAQTETRRQADTEAGAVRADRLIRQHSREQSLIGTAKLSPVAGLELSAGLRLAQAQLWLTVEDLRAGCAPCLAPGGPATQRQQLFTPEFSLGWRPVDGILLFARSVRSARLPGWNLLAQERAALTVLPAETGWHHEAGVKADLAGGRARVNAAAFSARTRGAVSPLLGVDPLAAIVAADMTASGVDLAAQAHPVRQLDLSGTLTVQRVRWQGLAPAAAPSRPLFAPDVAASVHAAWRQPLVGAGANLVPRLGLEWRSAMAVAAGDVISADGKSVLRGGLAPGGLQVSAALQLEIPDGGWLMSVECNNCLDRALVDGAVAGLPLPNRPRWWQVRLIRRF